MNTDRRVLGRHRRPILLGGGCAAKFRTDELKSLTRASLVPWSMRRIPVIATLMFLIVVVAACGGGPATTTIPTIGLGVSLHDAEHFFNLQGGGGWIPGEYTGGEIGYAGGNATGRYCPAQLSGQVKELNHIYVACLNVTATKVTPEETAAVIQATVHRFVPAATDWARETMASLSSSSSSATSTRTKISGSTYLSISQSQPGVVLEIEPVLLAKGQRLPGTPRATSTTG